MMEPNTLRKTDICSGAVILLLGLFIVYQALQMPMKDSWGGVQNVWFVSPALFPLFVGSMLALLGLALISIALKTIGRKGLSEAMHYLATDSFRTFLLSGLSIRFYAVVIVLSVFVFLMIPRIDFFPASIFFLLLLFLMFYLCDSHGLLKLLYFTLCFSLFLTLLLLPFPKKILTQYSLFYADWIVIFGIAALCLIGRTLSPEGEEFRKKYKRLIIIAFSAPTIIGIIFKYFLLVPMPFEGIVVALLDSLWYAEFWS